MCSLFAKEKCIGGKRDPHEELSGFSSFFYSDFAAFDRETSTWYRLLFLNSSEESVATRAVALYGGTCCSSVLFVFSGMNSIEIELTQCLVSFGVSPSPTKTCPRCAPHFAH